MCGPVKKENHEKRGWFGFRTDSTTIFTDLQEILKEAIFALWREWQCHVYLSNDSLLTWK